MGVSVPSESVFPLSRVPLSGAHSPGRISCQLSAIGFTSSRIKVELTSSENKANVEQTSYPCLTPNPVTSTNIGSPVPSTQIPHHLIIPQPSNGW
ncbi:hypothetical protein O181_081129 [Austropuccinia psidii MF-1]|uniref:Uncharacterized protein n=1 Tax=Austropuccinia psidii MF-1 TaxID=1389203 RepID=A0A9Q3FM89_9BASI|nr:hypothetical protein [Austropuccinia psidii MF-1]